ncbi:hypothetical protein ACNVED_11520 [Legionella sp. D16C41]|uniref:hypothetical protein n=1 Tax=Legionella sp. D16C41 TaxID=3402688 RepID=UPI003AF70867
MPEINAALLNKLRHEDFLKDLTDKAAPLDAILAKGHPLDQTKLAQAIDEHKAFWERILGVTAPLTVNNTDLATIIKLVGEKRAIIALRMDAHQSSHEVLLKEIIEVNTPDNVRQKISQGGNASLVFGAYLISLVGRNTADQTYVNNTAADEIQLEAQYQLLSLKINQALQPLSNPSLDATTRADLVGKLHTLLTHINTPNNGQFQAAIRALVPSTTSLSDAVLNKMVVNNGVGARIKSDVALKAFNANIKQIYETNFSRNANTTYATLQKADNAFINDLPLEYQSIAINKFKEARAALGNQYLINHYIPSIPQNDLLLKIANAKTKDDLKPLLKGTSHSDYLDDLLNSAKNIKEYRELAAAELLIRNINNITDEAALKSLADMRKGDALPNILENHTNLGFTGPANIAAREALGNVTMATLGAVVAAAHVRLSIVATKNSPTELTRLKSILTDNNNFNQPNHLVTFPFTSSSINTNAASDILTQHFSKAENRTRAKEQALIKFLQLKLADPAIGINRIKQITDENSSENIKKEMLGLLSLTEDSTALDDVFTADDLGNPKGISRQLLAQAYVAHITKAAENELDFSDEDNETDYDTLISHINLAAENEDYGNTAYALETLSDIEKKDLSTKLTEILVRKRPANKLNELVELSNATSLADFKRILNTKFGITSQDWVNDKTMESVQKAAIEGAITHQIETLTGVKETAYPALKNVIKDLSLKQQREMLNVHFLSQLVDSRDAKDISERLHCKADQAQAILQDFKRIDSIKRIYNAEIVKRLLEIDPPIEELDSAKVDILNNEIKKSRGGLSFADDSYDIEDNSDISRIIAILNTAVDDEKIRQALQGGQEEVEAQSGYNRNLLPRVRNAFDPATATKLAIAERETVNFLLPLTKDSELSAHQISKIVNAFKDPGVNTKQEFITAITTGTNAISGTILTELKRELTPKRYAELKNQFIQANFLDKIQAGPLPLVNPKLKDIKTLNKKISSGTSGLIGGIEKDLEGMVNGFPGMHWLNPIFQAAAAQDAHNISKKMQLIANGCDILVTQLEYQKKIIAKELAQLPSQADINKQYPAPTDAQKARIKEINERRKELEDLKAETDRLLEKYKKVQKVIYGDPDGDNIYMKKGALKVIQEAKEAKSSVKLNGQGYNYSVQNYPMSELKNQLQSRGAAAPTTGNTGRSQLTGPGSKSYDPILDIPKDHFRKYEVIAEDGSTSSFVKVPGKQDLVTSTNNGKVSTNPSADFLCEDFPGGEIPPLDPAETPEIQKKRIAYSFIVASEYLRDFNGPPEEGAIKLGGTGKLGAAMTPYLWTALMILGEKNPHMKFDHKAIAVDCSSFDPKTQFRGGKPLLGISGDSVYKKVFNKHQATCNQFVNQHVNFDKDKFEKPKHNKEKFGQHVKEVAAGFEDKSNSSAVTRLFRKIVKSEYTEDVVKEVETANKTIDQSEQQMKLK